MGTTTEYEFSARLIFWGDVLDSQRLADDLRLTVSKRRTKGEPLRRPDGTDSGSVGKTGMLICELSSQGSVLRRDPEGQLVVAREALRQLAGALGQTYGVADAALQIGIYYANKTSGEPSFIFPSDLLELLVRHRIELRMTILP